MLVAAILVVLAFVCAFIAHAGGFSAIARDRKYKSGTGWCFWRWTDVESEYILRLHVVKTPWCAVCLHWIRKPDKEPWLHDHPVSFLSLILRGGYAEIRKHYDEPAELKVHRWYNFIRASAGDVHRIVFTRKNTLTLCFMGPKAREWGFHRVCTWSYWKDYYRRLKRGEDVRDVGHEDPSALPDWHTRKAADDFNWNLKHRESATDQDVRAVDTAPAEPFDAEEVTDEYEAPPYADFTISREDLYKKVKF